MRAAAIETFGGPEVLKIMELAKPEPRPGEVLIALKGAGVGPWDGKMRESPDAAGDPALPYILGFEGAGVVVAVGDGVSNLRVGDEVYTYRWPGGCFAEYIAASAEVTGRKPSSLSFDEAAGVPVAGLTARQGVVEELEIKSGESLLITGAAGGVGTFAIQIAAAQGARVIAQVAADNASYVSDLGAADWVDYNDEDWVNKARSKAGGDGVDAVLDLVGEPAFGAAMRALRPGGRAAGIVGKPDDTPAGIDAHFYVGRADTVGLEQLAELFDAGKIKTQIQAVRPLEEVGAAIGDVEARRVRGKLVLHIAD
jgi:NADPH:quinone reductase-like Zn-dependent oxidoreductase